MSYLIITETEKKQIGELTEDSDELHEVIYNVENQMNDLNQYSRRNNIETLIQFYMFQILPDWRL